MRLACGHADGGIALCGLPECIFMQMVLYKAFGRNAENRTFDFCKIEKETAENASKTASKSLWMCKRRHFVMQKVSFYTPKCRISHAGMRPFVVQKDTFCSLPPCTFFPVPA